MTLNQAIQIAGTINAFLRNQDKEDFCNALNLIFSKFEWFVSGPPHNLTAKVKKKAGSDKGSNNQPGGGDE